MKNFLMRFVFTVLLSIAAPVYMDRAVVWGEGTITEHQATEIANKEILKKGKDISSFTVDVDEHWNRQLKHNPNILDHFPVVASGLRGKHFWAVHYSPKSINIRGGAFTVFVEKETGEVLGVIAWE